MHFPDRIRLNTAARVAVLLGAALTGACSGPDDPAAHDAPPVDPFPASHAPERLATIGPESCRECHGEAHAAWRASHHAEANRPIKPAIDLPAFGGERLVEESGVAYRMVEEDGGPVLRVEHPDGRIETHPLTGVIGYTPVRQYLAVFPGGRFQTISASFDTTRDSWIDVFAGEDRLPGEWGHWTGQGMNWNSNCAYCHTTEFHKNYDFASDSYRTEWLHQGVGCIECHVNMEVHARAAAMGDERAGLEDPSLPLQMENCATCHSRRDQLTADAFELGDRFADHFSLSLPDQPGLYYPDGQIRDEVFVWGSFRMSRMAHAGVTCFDCHDPHSNRTLLPAENNLLCMRCHQTGLAVGGVAAPVIEPAAHGGHEAGSEGNRCVACHMPKTPYMQVDPRGDHGFHLPDPLLTRELGIPNACARCHTEEKGEGLDWQIRHAEEWYGDKLADSRQRRRARAVAGAHEGDPEAADALLALAADEDIPLWTATYARLLAPHAGRPEVVGFLNDALGADDPLVREGAIAGLTFLPEAEAALAAALEDPVRSVRIAAARARLARGGELPAGRARDDWYAYLEFNADRPQSLYLIAHEAARGGELERTRELVGRAIGMDRLNPEAYREAAVLLNIAGDTETPDRYLQTGAELAPGDPRFPYLTGLLRAEQGDLEQAAGYLREACAIDPDFHRAWYNLALTLLRLDRTAEAGAAIQRAGAGMSNDPSWQAAYRAIAGRLAQEAAGEQP